MPTLPQTAREGWGTLFVLLFLGFLRFSEFVAVIYGLRFHGGEIGQGEAAHDFASA